MSHQLDGDTELATTFARVARQLQSEESPSETWQRLVDLASEVTPEFEHAAISLVHRSGRVDTVAATDEVPRAVDRIQYETGEGPCLSAVRESDMFVSDDLANEHRWPTFTERAVTKTGVRSMLSFRLFVAEETLGALNLYCQSTNGFGERAQALGSVLAAHAAVAMSAAEEHRQAEQLEEALATSRDIGTAVGILMVQMHVDRDRAFRTLAEGSMRTNIKLRDLAARVVSSEEEHSARPRASHG